MLARDVHAGLVTHPTDRSEVRDFCLEVDVGVIKVLGKQCAEPAKKHNSGKKEHAYVQVS